MKLFHLRLVQVFSMAAVMTAASGLLTPAAQADSIDLPFSGTVNARCTFGTVVNGFLNVGGTTTSAQNQLGSVALSDGNTTVTMPTISGIDARPATTTITCNSDVEIYVSTPVADPANPPLDAAFAWARLSLSDGTVTQTISSLTYAPQSGPVVSGDAAAYEGTDPISTITVDMNVQSNMGAIRSGVYRYTVNVTAVPQ